MPTLDVVIVGKMTLPEVSTGPLPPGPGNPPGIWGPPGPWPSPPIYFPPGGGGQPPSIWPSPGHPAHPIYNPPGIWGPTDPRPGWGLPGSPPGIWGGANQPFPTPPIHMPPSGGEKPPTQPPGTWGGAGEPFPTPPINLPGGEGGREPKFEWKTGWSPQTGWVVVAVPKFDTPVPSEAPPSATTDPGVPPAGNVPV